MMPLVRAFPVTNELVAPVVLLTGTICGGGIRTCLLQ